MKTLYDHGERTSPKACFECKCEDGSMECKQKDPNLICPPLPCPSSQQFSVPGECCKFCPGTIIIDDDVVVCVPNKPLLTLLTIKYYRCRLLW